LAAEQAQFAALTAFGNTTIVKEDVREVWGWMSVERFIQDLRFAIRILGRAPVFTVVPHPPGARSGAIGPCLRVGIA
jgi:hypothetical protein